MPANTSHGWVHLYHMSRWSNILDFFGFLVEVLAALTGLSVLVYLTYTTVRALLLPGSNLTEMHWPATLFSFAASGLLAYWGLHGTWHLFMDAFRPAATYEGRADKVEVTWVTTSRNGYHLWTLSAGGQAWSIPTPPVSLKTGIQPGTTVRLRYRAGTRAVTDVWVLRARRRSHSHRDSLFDIENLHPGQPIASLHFTDNPEEENHHDK